MNQAKALIRVIVESYVKPFCQANNLSPEKLSAQKFEIIADTIIFAQPTDVKPDGLRNDIDTQPKPTLVLQLNSNGEIQIETTECTEKYLRQ